MKRLFAAIFLSALSSLFFVNGAFPADVDVIRSQIVDTDGEPLIGVTVMVEGTSQGTTTDLDGNFQITPPAGATSLKISYIGMKSQNLSLDSVPEKIVMAEDAYGLDEVVVAACGPDAVAKLNAKHAIVSKTTNKCIPTECKDFYELSGQEYLTDEDGDFELDDEGQKILVNAQCVDTNGRDCDPMPENAKIAKLENGQCVIRKCDEPRYKLVSNQCVDQVGTDCTSKAEHAVQATYQIDDKGQLVCRIVKCDEPGWVRNEDGTRCEESDGPCTAAQLQAVAHATSGSLRRGECIISACERGWHPAKDGKSCEQAELSESDSKQKVADLKDNAQKMKDKEQSTANKLLGAASIGTTGIGGMNLMSGLAEQNADDAAEEDMKAYLATFVCDYGQGRNIKGGETAIDLPGGNELIGMVTEYRALAADLKVRKEALGKTPGIESEIIYDIAETGLYDNVGMGRQSGAYTSLYRALTDENSEDAAAWAEQKQSAHDKTNTGLRTAIAGAGVGIVGNLALNSGEKNKNKVDEINNKYDNLKQSTQEAKVSAKPNMLAQNQEKTSIVDTGVVSGTDTECVNNSDCLSGKVCTENKCIDSVVEVVETDVVMNQIYGLVYSKTVPGADVFPDTFKTVIKDSNDNYVVQDIEMTVVPKQTTLSVADFKSQEMANCIALQMRWTNKTANCYKDRKMYVYNVSLLCPKEGAEFEIVRKFNGALYDYYLEADGVSAKVEADSVYMPNSNTGNDIRYEDGAKNIFGYNNNVLISDPERDYPINPDFHGTDYSKCNQKEIHYTTIMQIWPKKGLLTAEMLLKNFEIRNFTFAEKTEWPE